MNGVKAGIALVVLASASLILVVNGATTASTDTTDTTTSTDTTDATIPTTTTTPATTPRWKPHDCRRDHRPHPDVDRENWFQRLIGDEWIDEQCSPLDTVFKLENCSCLFEDAGNSSRNETCQDQFRGVNTTYEYEQYALNQWVRHNCHELVDAMYFHKNDLMMYNETTCTCEYITDIELAASVKPSEDCATLHWIDWAEQPLVDQANSYLEVYSPRSKVWPPTVEIGPYKGRQAIHMRTERILTWYMAGNEKEILYVTFGLASDGQKDEEFQIVLSDACMMQDEGEFVMYTASFEIKYRPSDRTVQVDHRDLTFNCTAGSDPGAWTNLTFSFITGAEAPLLCVDGEDCPLVRPPTVGPTVGPTPPTLSSTRMNPECYMTIGGSPLQSELDYTGYISEFKMESGNDCPNDCLNEDIA